MKINSYYLLLLFVLVFYACSNEDLNDPLTEKEEIINENESDDDGITAEFPCDFDLSGIEANSTVVIDCLMDLEGKSIELPAGVTFEFDGGDIFNGTLKFNQGAIDGRLLNSKLTIEGEATLINPIFKLNASRWDIVQGQTSLENAKANKEELEGVFNLVKSLGGSTVKINHLDAYFSVGNTNPAANFYPSREAINVPSDFTLEMTDNTNLRVFPNDSKKYTLLAVRDASNVVIKGGILWGEREDHIFTGGGTHEWGHCLELHAAVNTTISGVTMKHGNGDGLKIHSLNFTFQDNYKPSHDVLVTGCTFDNNRRNNISITDGYDIIVENNQILNAGQSVGSSTGIAPKYGIDVEAHRERNSTTGELILYERARDIIIRDNVEKNSASSGIGVYIGENVIVENNQVESSISWQYTQGTVIRNNTLVANPNDPGTGIVGGRSDNIATTFDNEVYGNTITGYENGITVFSRENKIYNNTINNCEQGIFLRVLKDSEIYGNKINSTIDGSKGVFAHVTTLENVDLYDNEINVDADPFKFVQVNTDSEASDYEFTVRDNTFISTARAKIENTNGLQFSDNTVQTSTSIYNSKNMTLSGNTITSGRSTGIHLREVNEDITIRNNSIQVNANVECITIESTTNPNEVEAANNSCVER